MQGGLSPAKGKDLRHRQHPLAVAADRRRDRRSLLTIIARVNGEKCSRGHSGAMHHKFADVIAHVSADETLRAGEFFGSGRVAAAAVRSRAGSSDSATSSSSRCRGWRCYATAWWRRARLSCP
jgi:2-keto-4-pentenoate hydratase/2-oxohepta-3-ene-1,7-dioic acid hydratase in catechol pathway